MGQQRVESVVFVSGFTTLSLRGDFPSGLPNGAPAVRCVRSGVGACRRILPSDSDAEFAREFAVAK
jgi:hypothetical protein